MKCGGTKTFATNYCAPLSSDVVIYSDKITNLSCVMFNIALRMIFRHSTIRSQRLHTQETYLESVKRSAHRTQL